MPIVGNEVCNRHYQNTSADAARQIIKDDMLCAGSEGRDSCQVGPRPTPSSRPSSPTRGHCRALRAASPAG